MCIMTLFYLMTPIQGSLLFLLVGSTPALDTRRDCSNYKIELGQRKFVSIADRQRNEEEVI